MQEILQVEKINTVFKGDDGTLVKAVNNVSFSLGEGEILGLVGESGSGKSMTCRSIIRLLPPNGKTTSGKVMYKNDDLLSLPEDRMEGIRGKEISMILQEPMTALNPVWTIGKQITETLVDVEGLDEQKAKERAIEALRMVGIPGAETRVNDYPHQFSGGMRQRVLIAIALSSSPKILIADEPTTALDVTVQDQIVDLIRDLQKKIGMSVIWVTHDLGVVAQLCNRVAVLYAGQVMEIASTIELFENSKHPYTKGLIASIPSGTAKHKKLVPIPGQPPNLSKLPDGCPFAPRCYFSTEMCFNTAIKLNEIAPNHYSACLRALEL